jgi:hypothetical protein
MPSSASSGRAPGLQRSGRPSDTCGRSDHSQWLSPLRVTEPSAGGRRREGAPRRAGARDAPAARAPAAGPPGRHAPGAPVLTPRRRRRTAEVGAPRPRGRDPGGGHRACRLAGQGRRRDRRSHLLPTPTSASTGPALLFPPVGGAPPAVAGSALPAGGAGPPSSAPPATAAPGSPGPAGPPPGGQDTAWSSPATGLGMAVMAGTLFQFGLRRQGRALAERSGTRSRPSLALVSPA